MLDVRTKEQLNIARSANLEAIAIHGELADRVFLKERSTLILKRVITALLSLFALTLIIASYNANVSHMISQYGVDIPYGLHLLATLSVVLTGIVLTTPGDYKCHEHRPGELVLRRRTQADT